MSETQTTLVAKLHRVAQAISHIEKNGRNKDQGYSFVQAVDVVRDIREELLKEKVIVLPGASGAEHREYQTARGRAAFLTTVDLSYQFICAETGERFEVPWVGVGADQGGDKGIYKAYTGGLKYMLLNTFLIPTSDDPERDQLTERDEDSKAHKDDERPVAPRIPVDRAKTILDRAQSVELAKIGEGGVPELSPVFQALLAQQGVEKIGALNVDQAEAVEAFLEQEAKGDG